MNKYIDLENALVLEGMLEKTKRVNGAGKTLSGKKQIRRGLDVWERILWKSQ